MNLFQPFLQTQPFLVLDGALATELEQRGAKLDDPLWSAKLLLDNPDMIRQLHIDYLDAGADVIISASYQATFEGLAQRGIAHKQAADLMRFSVQLAMEARDEFWTQSKNHAGRQRPLVAASVGPYGAYLADGSEYRGDYGLSVDELMEFHRERMGVLAGSGADLLACETIPCLIEGEALVRLLAEFSGAQAWLSFSCRDEEHANRGESFADCVGLANQSKQVVAVGVNCTPPQFVAGLLRRARQVTQKPLLAYPNSGEAWRDGQWVEESGRTDFCGAAAAWRAAGAQLIGGCCRTGPAEVAGLRQLARQKYPDGVDDIDGEQQQRLSAL